MCIFKYTIYAAFLLFSDLHSKAEVNDTIKKYTTEAVSIFSDRTKLLSSIPGSAAVITPQQLNFSKNISSNQALQTVAGVNVVEEEGAGLRMNLGIRGLDPDRSRTLLVLEDGVPVALAPYGEPELYYTPSIDRMNSIEVLKGSGSIIYGPQTIGGVLNYITNDPPLKPQTRIKLSGGNSGFMNSSVGYGSTNGSMGFLSELHYKKADKLGLTNYKIVDFMSKAKFIIDSKRTLQLKLGIYNEVSNSTYVGITQSMYDAGEYFTEIAPYDELGIRRYSASLKYQEAISTSTIFDVSLFGYTTTRDWRRQDFGRNSSVSNKTGAVFGDTSEAGGAIYMRNTTANRNRAFDVLGVQPQMVSFFEIAGAKNELTVGARFLIERAYEQRINGTNFKAVSGSLVEDETRTGMAYNVYLQDRLFVAENFVITPGLRFENFDYERNIFRLQSKDTLIEAGRGISILIPGLGMNYNISDKYTIFAGAHRGFAPPRTKDAITNEGVTLDLEAELSWNYELGLRAGLSEAVSFELTAYMLDFSNQVIPVSESSGGAGFGLVNGGKTLHTGAELSFGIDFGRILESDYSIILNLNGTFSKSKFNSDRFITKGNDRINVNGNKLQYAPETMFSSILSVRAPFGLSANIKAVFVGEQFTDELNTIEASPDGTIGLMASHFVLDFTLLYDFSENMNLYFSVKNIADERYIASRRPQGIKVGLPRLVTAGLDFKI